MRNWNNTQKSTGKDSLGSSSQARCLSLSLPQPLQPRWSVTRPTVLSDAPAGTAPDPVRTSLCPWPARPSHRCRIWHLLQNQVMLQRWPQTLLLLQAKGASREGPCQALCAPRTRAGRSPGCASGQRAFRYETPQLYFETGNLQRMGQHYILQYISVKGLEQTQGSSPIKALLLWCIIVAEIMRLIMLEVSN